ncbi:MAG: tRNA lysidine(34) synthetase TilS [Pseudomonadota bacterium]
MGLLSEDAIAAFSSGSAVVLAVSGGSDSLALLHLFAEWNASCAAPIPTTEISVVTVDHGLRPEARQEAADVFTVASRLGFAHTTLTWEEPKPEAGLMEAARNARYRLMTEHCNRRFGRRRVLVATGHTRDDDVETFVMNLARGSGIDGLSGMWSNRAIDRLNTHIRLVRPLIACRRSDLRAYLKTRNEGWVDDPTNADETFERSRLRAALATTGPGDDAVRGIETTMRRLREVQAAADQLVSKVDDELDATSIPGLVAVLPWRGLADQPAYVGKRVLREKLAAYGGSAMGPSLKQIDAIWDKHIANVETAQRGLGGSHQSFQVTVAGCLIRGEPAGQGWIEICREPDRDVFPTVRLSRGTRAIWDRRFAIEVNENAATDIVVGPRHTAFWMDLEEKHTGRGGRSGPRPKLMTSALRGLPVASGVGNTSQALALPDPFRPLSGEDDIVQIRWLGSQAFEAGPSQS